MKNIKINRGFAPLLILLVIAFVAVIGGGSYYVSKHYSAPEAKENVSVNSSSTVTTDVSTGTDMNNGAVHFVHYLRWDKI